MPPRLTLLGAPTIEPGDGAPPAALPFERRHQLVALLALKGTWVGRAELASMLWPEQAAKLAFSNLRKALFRLQDTPAGVLLEAQGQALRVATATDVHAFERALREQRVADALGLYRGPLLAGYDDDANESWTAWLRFERERLHAAWRAAALGHLAGEVAEAEALALAARLLEADPLDEAALRVQLTCLARGGQASRARAAYRAYAERLRDELGLAPGAELQSLHDALGSAATAASAQVPVRTEAEDDAGFVGRAAERRRIDALLSRDDVRLLSVTGPGGIGKTRLARRAAHELAGHFADGAVFVRLEDVADEAGLWARVARELGLALNARAPAGLQLGDALQGRDMLLVLDNFEQLVDTAPALGELLAHCPRLKLLVTSRVRLGLAAEHLMAIEGLPCPDPEDLAQIDGFDAVRVFVAAAQRVEPALLPSSEAAAIVEICRLVDGLPLALELAAAWTRVLSCAAIAAELREGTALLRDTGASASRRHASIEQVFEQSFARLTAVERDALGRLAVFQGGFAPEAARAVARTPLPVLGALVDKSLLRKDGARLSLHPLVQQLAAARAGDATAVRAAHAAHFHQMLAQLQAACQRGDRQALQTVDDEFENCRLAWRWSVAQGQADELRRSNATLQDYYHHRARYLQGLTLLREALDAAACQRDAALRAGLLGWTAFLEFRLDLYEAAEADATRALAVGGRGRDRAARLIAMKVMAGCALATGRFEAAARWNRQAIEQAEAGGLDEERAPLLENLALAEKRLGHYDEALRLTTQALAEYRRSGDIGRLAMGLSNLGSFCMFLDDNAAAALHLQQALQLSEQHGLVTSQAYTLANLVELALKSGERDTARRHAERALELTQSAGLRSLSAWLLVQLARLAAHRGALDEARARLAAGAELALALTLASAQAAVLLGLAELLEAAGDAAAACHVLAFAVEQPTLSAPDRDELRTEWARRVAPGVAIAPWPAALTLPLLLQRVVDEAAQGHVALRALLRGNDPARPA